jgi:hypothetical protein
MVVHPLSIPTHQLTPGSLLQPGYPTAPRGGCLPLLPPGPGGVHRPLPRRTRSSTPLARSSPAVPYLEREFDPAIAVCGYRAPLAPRLARPSLSYVGPLLLSNELQQAERAGFEPARLNAYTISNRAHSTKLCDLSSSRRAHYSNKRGLCKKPFAGIIRGVGPSNPSFLICNSPRRRQVWT